jgi:pimeloyl-ACP methyl ester carboxylesterase
MSDNGRGSVEIRQIRTAGGGVHVADRPGDEPALVLMHGFPDDSRIYNRLLSWLAPRRVVAFDFLGYGRSERAPAEVLGAADPLNQLRTVLDALDIETAGLVAHDASGPVAIDFALSASERVGQLVLLNTYYGHAPTLRLPEMIRLLADPALTPLADAMMQDPDQRCGYSATRPASSALIPLIATVSGRSRSRHSSLATQTSRMRWWPSEPGPQRSLGPSTPRTTGSPRGSSAPPIFLSC